MANDKDITIGLKTVGDTSGAEKVEKSLDDVKNSAQETNKQYDQEKEQHSKASEAAEKHSESIKKIEIATRAMAAAQAVGLLKEATAKIREATEAGGLLHEEIGDLGSAMDGLDAGLSSASAGLSTFAATGNPVLAVLASLGSAVGSLITEYGKLKEQTADTASAEDEHQRQLERSQKWGEYRRNHPDDLKHLKAISAENAALHDQEESFQRLIDLRNEMAGIGKTAADQEVDLAKLTGGDVALAESNALAANLSAKLETLNGNLARAQQEAAIATSDHGLAVERLNQAQDKVKAGLMTAEHAGIPGLQQAAKDAQTKTETATEKLNVTLAKYQGSHQNILRGAEIDLIKIEKEYEGKTSAAAKKGFDAFYGRLVTEVDKEPPQLQQAIAQIQANTQEITSAAQTKATEVSQQVTQAAVATTQSVAEIATAAQRADSNMTLNIAVARNQVTQALDMLGDKVVTALSQITATTMANVSKINAQQAQIDQLFARLR